MLRVSCQHILENNRYHKSLVIISANIWRFLTNIITDLLDIYIIGVFVKFSFLTVIQHQDQSHTYFIVLRMNHSHEYFRWCRLQGDCESTSVQWNICDSGQNWIPRYYYYLKHVENVHYETMRVCTSNRTLICGMRIHKIRNNPRICI